MVGQADQSLDKYVLRFFSFNCICFGVEYFVNIGQHSTKELRIEKADLHQVATALLELPALVEFEYRILPIIEFPSLILLSILVAFPCLHVNHSIVFHWLIDVIFTRDKLRALLASLIPRLDISKMQQQEWRALSPQPSPNQSKLFFPLFPVFVQNIFHVNLCLHYIFSIMPERKAKYTSYAFGRVFFLSQKPVLMSKMQQPSFFLSPKSMQVLSRSIKGKRKNR